MKRVISSTVILVILLATNVLAEYCYTGSQLLSISEISSKELMANGFTVSCLMKYHTKEFIKIESIQTVQSSQCSLSTQFIHAEKKHYEYIHPSRIINCSLVYPRLIKGYSLTGGLDNFEMTCNECGKNYIKIQVRHKENSDCSVKWSIRCMNTKCNNLYEVTKQIIM